MANQATALQRLRDLVWVLTQKELRVRYKSYSLGYLWSLLNPLAQGALFFFVFQTVMRTDTPNFLVFLLTGLFFWQALSNSIGVAPMTFLGNAPLIKKVKFPYLILPLVATLQDIIHLMISVPILVGLLFYFGLSPSWTWVYGLPLMMTTLLTFAFLMGLMISSLNLFLRDLERIVGIMLMFLFYGTPIVYEETRIPPMFSWVVEWNPVALMVINWRSLILEGTLDWDYLIRVWLLMLPLALVSLWTYRKLKPRFAEVL